MYHEGVMGYVEWIWGIILHMLDVQVGRSCNEEVAASSTVHRPWATNDTCKFASEFRGLNAAMYVLVPPQDVEFLSYPKKAIVAVNRAPLGKCYKAHVT